jgi:23S rRNA (uracil1939-C5)-methyltransferase
MGLHAGQELELPIEKPAAGGRMIGRHDGQVILILGAIPGERVVARVDRAERQVAFASTLRVLQASSDRRETAADPLCGGCSYSHVAYPRQLDLKAQVIQDAFIRLGRIPIEQPVPVAPSPERGYRMRARLHVRGGRVGFYREGSHELCDAAATNQLGETSVGAVERAVASLDQSGYAVTAVELTENIAATERALHLTPAAGTAVTQNALDDAVAAGGLTGATARTPNGTLLTSGVPIVADPLEVLTSGNGASAVLERHPESFFQANRFLLPQLVTAVLDAVAADGEVLDLYAGVGLFSVSLAASGRKGITAVEGDRSSGRDLARNAANSGGAIRVCVDSVEDYLRRRRRSTAETIIVDPPRIGISRDAMKAIGGRGASHILYVSCDPATMARDARRLLDSGYRMVSLRAFDLFPNTPHVESLGVFRR